MSLPTTDTHDVDAIDSLADISAHLRGDGYEVVLAPAVADIPAFARAARPDLIARGHGGGGGGGVVRTRAELVADPAMAAAADAIRRQPGWRLDVLVRAGPA